jgi:hypothetical protein
MRVRCACRWTTRRKQGATASTEQGCGKVRPFRLDQPASSHAFSIISQVCVWFSRNQQPAICVRAGACICSSYAMLTWESTCVAGHATIREALQAQEQQLATLADVIPALDMVHSSLISSIALVRSPHTCLSCFQRALSAVTWFWSPLRQHCWWPHHATMSACVGTISVAASRNDECLCRHNIGGRITQQTPWPCTRAS